jgi:hypothetical protein
MENPETWGKLEQVIDEALRKADADLAAHIIGLSTVRVIADALRREKLIRPEPGTTIIGEVEK